jgi:hypothetical protein
MRDVFCLYFAPWTLFFNFKLALELIQILQMCFLSLTHLACKKFNVHGVAHMKHLPSMKIQLVSLFLTKEFC